MANEITVPLLPCRDVDEIVDSYSILGFTRTYYQTVPNPYVALKRDDIQLHFFDIADFNPEDSYGSCLVIVRDTGRSTEHSPRACAPLAANSSFPVFPG